MSDHKFNNLLIAMAAADQTNKNLRAENARLTEELESEKKKSNTISLQLKSANTKLESVSQYADNIENDVITPYRVSTALLNNGEEILTQTTNVATLVVASLRSIIR